MKHRRSIAVSATALAVATFGATPVAHPADRAVSAPAASEQFVPFVTDFPRASATKEERFVPFVTDFPKTPAPAPAGQAPTTPSSAGQASTSGTDWGDVAITSGAGGALAALLAVLASAFKRRTGPAHS